MEQRETVELSITVPKCLLVQLEEDMPLLKGPQDRLVVAAQYYAAEDSPATPGDVNHEVRHAFFDLMGDIYPQDVMDRLDDIEEQIQDLDD